MNTVEYWKHLHGSSAQIRDAHLSMLDNAQAGKIRIDKHWDLDWVSIGLSLGRSEFSNQILQAHGVPAGLTVKQGIAFLQLRVE